MDCLKLDYCFPERPERRNAWSGKKVVQWEVGTGEKVVQVWLSADPKAHWYPSLSPYAYALNNPVMYVDPNGEWVHLVVGAVIGGIMNLAMNAGNINNFWQGLGYFGVGAVAGALSAGMAAGMSSAIAVSGTFGAGFIGSSAAVSSTGFVAGMVTGTVAGMPSGFILNAGNSWLGGSSFGQGLLDGFKGAVMGGITGGITGGIMRGLDAASRGRDFWTGSSKTYKLQLNQIASTDGIPYEQYITPPGKPTIINTDSYNVYYKPEDGVYGIADYVKPGYAHYDPIDGVATSKYRDAVFKVPNGGRVKVLPGGDVEFLNPVKTWTQAHKANVWSVLTTGQNYEFGWMPLSKLDNSWIRLFQHAFIIK